jgi:hypothetical protein
MFDHVIRGLKIFGKSKLNTALYPNKCYGQMMDKLEIVVMLFPIHFVLSGLRFAQVAVPDFVNSLSLRLRRS